MCKRKVTREKKVFIDMKTAFSKIKRETGERITSKSFAEKKQIHPITVLAWGKEAPRVVAILWEFLNEYDMKFEDLVKKE